MSRWFRGRRPDELTAVLLPEPLRGEVLIALLQHGEVAAVRLVRQQTGLGLLPAVLAVRAAAADAAGTDTPGH